MTNNKYDCNFWIKILISIALPFIGMLLLFLRFHMGFEDISIITSGWNDETTYYKQIEAMITYGNPQGYFGFNESHSIYGNFAAWSPVLLMPYVIIGKLFTWNYYTSIIFHLFIWISAFLLLTISLRPDYKQLLSVAAVWLSFEVGL